MTISDFWVGVLMNIGIVAGGLAVLSSIVYVIIVLTKFD